MYINQYSKNRETSLLFLLFLISLAARIPVVLMYGDETLDHEWKHLVYNLIVNGQLVYETFDDFLLPNLWMPPLYAYYIYIFSFFGLEGQNFVLLVLFSQVLLASISVLVFYKINKLLFSRNICFYSSLLFSLFPLHLYACSQISSISLQIFFYIFFIYLFFLIKKENKNYLIVIFSILAGLILLLRSEFQAIFVLSILYMLLFSKLSIKNFFLILIITLMTISPYLVRNYLIFDKITLTKTFGYNLWKGNHPYALKNSLVEGSEIFDENLMAQSAKVVDGFVVLDAIPKDKYYRFKYDSFFLDQALKNIKKDLDGYLIFFFKKIASFLLIDIKSSDPNYYKPVHFLPVLLLGVSSLVGIIFSDKKSYQMNYLILIFFTIACIFSTVSILPRYKLIILPIQIILTNVLIERIGKYWKSKFFLNDGEQN
tara:strand:+ start:967 stop:2250 length:1284 start_codon:yes stop_codon:yes gene_type:complete